MEIRDGSGYLAEIRGLITEYTESLHRNLAFQSLSDELDHLKEKYTEPNGEILAAVSDEGAVIGCVAFRRLTDRRCEMKRLYVRPEYRALKAGRKLIGEIIKLARGAGFEEMVLDTIRPLKAAISLYRSFGFEEMEAYYDNPMEDVLYMRLRL